MAIRSVVTVPSSQEHHQLQYRDREEEERASSSSDAPLPVSATAAAADENVNCNINAATADMMCTHTSTKTSTKIGQQGGSHNVNITQPIQLQRDQRHSQQQPTTPVLESPFASSREDHEVGLSLSVGSRSPSPPSPPSNAVTMTSAMASQVSDDVLSAAVEAAASQTAQNRQASSGSRGSSHGTQGGGGAVDASLLPRPLPLLSPTFTALAQHGQQQHSMPLLHRPPLQPDNVDLTDPLTATSTQAATTSSAQLEARLAQLEQSLSTVTQLCQNLLLQQQQHRSRAGSRRHSRQGSEATGEVYTPPGGNSSPNMSSSPESSQGKNCHYSDSDPRLLPQWPASHPLLESPEVSMAVRLQRRQQYQKRSSRQSSGSLKGSQLRNSWSGEDGYGGMPNSKTMSMLLLDIDPGESRGPNMIPFTSDLDACDEMDGDSVAGGCRDGRADRGISDRNATAAKGGCLSGSRGGDDGGNNSRSGSDSLSIDGSSDSSGSEKRRKRDGLPRHLSSSLKEHAHLGNRLECQTFADTHLEALRLRREAGKGRAYSLNDSDLIGGKAPGNGTKAPMQQWMPTLDSLDGSVREPISASSVISSGTFVDVRSQGTVDEPDGLDLNMPDLSLPDASRSVEAKVHTQASDNQQNNNQIPREVLSTGPSANEEDKKQTKSKSVGSNMTLTTAEMIVRNTSCASNMSCQTLKSGNLNEQVRSSSARNKIHEGNGATLVSTSCKVERSHSVANTQSGRSSASNKDCPSADDPGNATTPSEQREDEVVKPFKEETNGKLPHMSTESETTKGKSPHKQRSSERQRPDKASALADNNKNNQTMREYVINDLLNIDSRNHDGSATEDIDENMEEFLRVPHKLEWLMVFSLGVCVDSFLYAWAMLPLKFIWGLVCLLCSVCSAGRGISGVKFRRRHLYPIMQSVLICFVYSQVLCPISIGKLYHWIRGQAMLKLYVLIAIVEVFDRLLCSFGQDAWDSLYWNTTRRPRHPRMLVSIIVVGVYVTVHSLFLFVHVATLSVAVNSADNALLTLLISGNFAEIKSTVFKKYNKQNLFKITTSDICERFKLALFLLLILFLNRFQGEMTSSMEKEYFSMCGIVFAAELISDWIKHSFITKFNLIKSSVYFDYALILSSDVTGIGHEGLNLDYTHAAVKRLGLAQIPLVCVTARYLHEAVRFAIAFQGNGDVDHPVAALVELMADGCKWKFYSGVLQGLVALVLFKIVLGMCIRFVARGYLGCVVSDGILKGGGDALELASRKKNTVKAPRDGDAKKKQQ